MTANTKDLLEHVAASSIVVMSGAMLSLPFVALVAWIAKVTPGIRLVHAQFQNLRPEEEPA